MSDDVRQRFRDLVELTLESHKVVFEEQERLLIGDGITKFDLNGEQARGVVSVVATLHCKILEREVSRNMMNIMVSLAGKKRAVSKPLFGQGVKILIGLTKGHITEARAKAWLKALIEESDLKVRGRGLLWRKRWFNKIKPVA